MPPTGSPSALRSANLERIVGVLRTATEVSQAEIARRTDLAPATVSNIVRQLVATGLVETSGGAGRRGLTVQISRRAGLVAGLDFGHSHLEVALGDLAGRPLVGVRRPLDNDHRYADGLALAEELLDDLLAELGESRDAVRAGGLGLPAPITKDGRITAGSILPGWVGVAAADVASAVLGIPILVDNDANLGALAEHHHDPGVTTLAYLKASSGIGCGLVLDGRLYRGGLGTAGELGHVTLDESGPLCRCGSRGCLEAYAGGSGLIEQLRGRAPDLAVHDLADLAVSGDAGARRLLEDAGRALGQGSAILANLLSPEVIVVGGDLACEILVDGIRDGLRRHAVDGLEGAIEVRLSTLGDKASVVGALVTALDAVALTG
ncbi:ROK family transcriptional regulator [Mumia sp. zg.B53]|uniref:ROK family transcriptional regulator n=1 Tax=unclassified Mumia TaxID=2621872 RepID=UPI001C6EE889|nr:MULTISPECIES: ROK family transcriptional regulator [unclassified Mumia]MBW9211735.1 ROK family transcriptional regulator [Mumia sp. zg.B21]MBW9216895.1 ROK family transcriptional regulator [Mumia sp. zg.B53]MDD9347397.1 ROK family transcriptional regulator [Mumia sp.]